MPAYPLFNYDKIAKAYKVFGSTRKVAKLIGCSNFTVCMVARKYNLPPTKQGVPPESHYCGAPPGKVAKWANAHPDVVIPLRPIAIQQVVGCTRQAAYHYLEWRRKCFKKKLDKLPDLHPYLNEDYTFHLDSKYLRVSIQLLATKRNIILHEDELDAILLRLGIT